MTRHGENPSTHHLLDVASPGQVTQSNPSELTVTEPVLTDVERQALAPGYETDPSAVGTNRTVDPEAVDDRPWYEVHGLTEVESEELL